MSTMFSSSAHQQLVFRADTPLVRRLPYLQSKMSVLPVIKNVITDGFDNVLLCRYNPYQASDLSANLTKCVHTYASKKPSH